MTKEEKMEQIKLSFENLSQLFEVLGDQNRQHLIYTLFSLPCKSKGGVRVGEITEKTHLSRPAVSHHLKLLKQVGIVGMRISIIWKLILNNGMIFPNYHKISSL